MFVSAVIRVHGKFTLQSNFNHFTESHFTLVLCCEFPFMPDSRNFYDFTLKLASFSFKITINGEFCHSLISHFTQIVKSETLFPLDSCKVWLRPIARIHYIWNCLWKQTSQCEKSWVHLYYTCFSFIFPTKRL